MTDGVVFVFRTESLIVNAVGEVVYDAYLAFIQYYRQGLWAAGEIALGSRTVLALIRPRM
jgi:hypothetical protein